MAEMIRIHLHCDNLYDNVPGSERFIPFEDGIYPLQGEPFGRDVVGGDVIHSVQVKGNDVIFSGRRYCPNNGDAVVKATFMYYKGHVPNPLYYTITLSKIEHSGGNENGR